MCALKFGSLEQLNCGMTILSPEYVMTAAHCVRPDAAEGFYRVQCGNVTISPGGPITMDIDHCILHEGYDEYARNDIAVCKLRTALEFSAFIQPIQLPGQGFNVDDGSNATLTGWGETETGSTSLILQSAALLVVNYEECARRHSSHTMPVEECHICAEYPGGGRGQCSGDSGGPIVVDGIQLGIVSWSVRPCTIAPYPGVYTRVACFRDWIKSKTGI